MAEPVEWKNRVGKSKWQPVLSTGERGWWHYYGWDGEREVEFYAMGLSPGAGREPCLVSYRKAVRIAKRIDRRRWSELHVRTFKQVPNGSPPQAGRAGI